MKGFNMKASLILSAILCVSVINGCGESQQNMDLQPQTGFLSDYSRLMKESERSLHYVDDEALADYSSFIVDPVVIFFHDEAESKGKLTLHKLADLTNYMHTKIIEAVEAANKKIVKQPGNNVARIRVALTDIGERDVHDILREGVSGGASMEAEIINSKTEEQVAAFIETRQGATLTFESLGNWSVAQNAMDYWALRFQKRLSE